MAVYRLVFKRSVAKDLRAIPKKDLRLILGRIEALAQNPRPVGAEKLTGQDRYRVRQGVYRIIYTIDEDVVEVVVVKVAHRREAYRS